MERTIKHQKPIYPEGTNDHTFQLLRKDVKKMISTLAPEKRVEVLAKAFLFPFIYVALWVTAMVFGFDYPFIFYAAYFGLGLLLVIIFLNIIHDAVHGTIFRSKRLNNILVYLFDLMGANSFIWKIRHVRFHHHYPNVNGWDTDIEQSEVARIFPSGPISRFHKYQYIYLPIIYPLFLFNWLLIRDFRDFFDSSKTVRKLIKIPPIEYVKLFLFKFLFFFYIILFPIYFLHIGWVQVLTSFVIMVFTASLFSLLVLLPPHANTHSSFPTLNEANVLPNNWFMHMLLTTNDVEEDNAFTRFFMGCFNYHVAHHLFPNVNHVYYPEITEKLKEYSILYKLPYRRIPLIKALYAHYVLLKSNGSSSDFTIWEESM